MLFAEGDDCGGALQNSFNKHTKSVNNISRAYSVSADLNSPQDSAATSGLAACAGEPAGELPGGAGSLLPPGGGGSKPNPPPVRDFIFDPESPPSFFLIYTKRNEQTKCEYILNYLL